MDKYIYTIVINNLFWGAISIKFWKTVIRDFYVKIFKIIKISGIIVNESAASNLLLY